MLWCRILSFSHICVCKEAFGTEAKGHKHSHPSALPFKERRHRVPDASIARDRQNFFPPNLISDSQVQRVQGSDPVCREEKPMRVQHTAASSPLHLNIGSCSETCCGGKATSLSAGQQNLVENKLLKWQVAAFDIKCRKEDLPLHMLTALLTGSVFLTHKIFLRPFY